MSNLFKNPPFVVITGLVVSIFLGAALLEAIASFYGPHLSFLDSLFTATSALTVTGLIVTDTAALHFASQLVILALIQVGGLGVMTAFAFLLTALRRKWGFGTRATMRDVLDRQFFSEVKGLVLFIIRTTFIFEGLGAVLFYIYFSGQMGTAEALFNSVFHAVSAFCNAGFMLFTDGFVAFQDNTYINIVTAFLIISGGFGFTAILAVKTRIFEVIKNKPPKTKLSLEVKIILWASLFLIIFGAAFLFLVEFNNPELGDIKSRVLTSFFQAVSARTAGFNTVDINVFSDAGRFFIMVLMFIGAAPASTAGGIKITTAFIILFGVFSFIRSETEINVWKRTIDLPTILKAFSVAAISLFILFSLTGLLTLFEDAPAAKVAFEAFSAFGTVGYSVGITAGATDPGKVIIMALMFLGRVGPLSLFFIYTTYSKKHQHSKISYIKEKIAVG